MKDYLNFEGLFHFFNKLLEKFNSDFISCKTTQKLSDEEKILAKTNIGVEQPDWNATRGQSGHILNRTHWIESVNPVFDGDLTGREYINITGMLSDEEAYIVKVSPQYISIEELRSSAVAFKAGNEDAEWPEGDAENVVYDATDIFGVQGTVLIFGGTEIPMVLSLPNDVNIEGLTLTSGTWFMYIPYAPLYIKSLSCLKSYDVIHKLDSKFLPDYLPRVEVVTDTPIFDGDLTGREYISNTDGAPIHVVKMSEKTFTKDELINSTMIVNVNGVDYESVISESMFDVHNEPNLIIEGTMNGLTLPLIVVNINDESIDIGTHFYYYNNNLGQYTVYPRSLSCLTEDTEIIHKIPEKFLPDYLPKVETIVGEKLISTTCQTKSLASYGGAFGANIPFANTLTAIPESVTVILDGWEYKDLAVITTPLGCIAGNLSKVNALQGTSFEDTGEPFMLGIDEYGCLLATDMTQSTEHSVTVKIPDVETVNKLDNKFIDAEWMATTTKGVEPFDGDITGKESIYVYDIGYPIHLVKITDSFFPVEMVVGSNMTIVVGGEEVTGAVPADAVSSPFGELSTVVGDLDDLNVISLGQDVTYNGKTISAGTWFKCAVGEGGMYIKSLSCISTEDVVNKIPEKFLPENIQSDWNQNDETQIDYVKNRTHWAEENRIASVEIDFTTNARGLYVDSTDSAKAFITTVEEGQNVKVSFDGVVYDCVVKLYSGTFGVGNRNISNAVYEDTGEPFFILFRTGTNAQIRISTEDTEATDHTLSMYAYELVYNTIPNEYIDTEWLANRKLVTTEIIPLTTCTSNGAGLVTTLSSSEYIDFEEDKTYTVIWNGVEYECNPHCITNGTFLGNCSVNSELSGSNENTGEPFIISPIHLNKESTSYVCFTNELNTGCTVSIVYKERVPNIIPSEFLPDVVTKEEYNAQRTHWTDREEIEFFPEGTYILETIISKPLSSFSHENFAIIRDSDYIKVGQKYIVNLDGIDYECEGRMCDVPAVNGMNNSDIHKATVYIGNIIALLKAYGCDNIATSIDTKYDTGEPFCFIRSGVKGFEGTTELHVLESYGAVDNVNFGIRQVNEYIHKIPKEYLPTPDWNASENEDGYIKNRTHGVDSSAVIFAEKDIVATGEWNESSGGWYESIMYMGGVDEYGEAVPIFSEPLVTGETYIVTLNGVIYECVCKEYMGTSYLGNGSYYLTVNETDVKDPFYIDDLEIVLGDASSADESEWILYQGDSAIISVEKKSGIHKLSEKFLPDSVNDRLSALEEEINALKASISALNNSDVLIANNA